MGVDEERSEEPMRNRGWAAGQVFEVTDETARAVVVPLQAALEAEARGPDAHLLQDFYVEGGAELRELTGSALVMQVVVGAGDRRRGRAAAQRVLRRAFLAAVVDPGGPLGHLPVEERGDAAEALYESTGARPVVDEEPIGEQVALRPDS
ncbi:hypothetical protein Ae168Ps1_6103 [Pseudonocardia sp. Ae168_Ps1]|nr:hypothetical protein Ae150APs1_6036 [Pseudonocardia sp. Ae150A_Ps1]OLL70638.1 hypothetical protein Ae168Ps1_6103 [Pseudonocardia sp. Ae168_Ps1]OLL70778.1 hypothetical protein Ae263Ps1_6192 [Pseudonocardia sp. Ae263_Ps1]OLL89339.1 hypothetical protein Ae356Ps1_6083 [Pseudonocardia sp. Ae356_Ps1]